MDVCLYVVFAFEQDLLPVDWIFHGLTFSFYIACPVDKDYTDMMLEAAFPSLIVIIRKKFESAKTQALIFLILSEEEM